MIVLVGESASGKSSIQNELVKTYGYKKVITYTTRPKRDYETAGYNDWYYGTAKKDCDTNIDDFKNGYQDNKVIVLTPHGLRNLQKYSDTTEKVDITSFYIQVPRRDRLIKILERNDNVDEAIRRNMSDVGQFDGIEDEVDYILNNNGFQFSVWEMAKKVHDLYS